MSIRIQRGKCVGCRKCTAVCPGNLIRISEKNKAEIRRVENCWGCTACLKECRAGAIEFFLGPDIGGSDVYMQIKKRGRILEWEFYDSEGPVRTIAVDSKNANRY